MAMTWLGPLPSRKMSMKRYMHTGSYALVCNITTSERWMSRRLLYGNKDQPIVVTILAMHSTAAIPDEAVTPCPI